MTYRADRVPRGTWILIVIAVLLIIFVAFSVVVSPGYRTRIVGPKVATGNPVDYIKQIPIPTATPNKAPNPPSELPLTFKFQGKTWTLGEGPISVNVLTTGKYADGHIIYRKQGDTPPYKTLYLEVTPNSGQFYQYVPIKTD